MGCAWAADGLGLLPVPVAVAAGASAASVVTWRMHLRSRSIRDAVGRTESQRAEAEKYLTEARDGMSRAEQVLQEVFGQIARGRQQIVWAASEVAQGRVLGCHTPPPLPKQTGDLYTDVFATLEHSQTEAWQAVIAAAAHQHHLLNADAELAEIFRPIAARLHALVNRTLRVLDEVERGVEDPDLLDDLFRVDNLVTLMRRGAESLAVLGGDSPTRAVEPVLVASMLRMALGEIEEYRRVQIVHSDHQPVALPGHVSPSVVHLLAELLENATRFSSGRVEVCTSRVPEGLAVEIVDRGPGMTAQKRAALNNLLARPEGADPRGRLREGQIGLLVASLLAKRHGVVIELHPAVMGGIRAVVVLPGKLLVTPTEQPAPGPAVVSSRAPAVVPLRGVPTGDEGPGRSVSGPPGHLPQTRYTTDGDASRHAHGRSGEGDGRPALPRREGAPGGRVPAPAVPQNPVGSPRPDLMARFKRTRPAGD
jgi:signal transduction histidine kinase